MISVAFALGFDGLRDRGGAGPDHANDCGFGAGEYERGESWTPGDATASRVNNNNWHVATP
jgi:hypothetical protein